MGLDFEVALLAQYRDVIERETGATIVVADSHVVSICKDKYMTALFLKEHGFLYPDSVLPEDVDGLIDRCGFPLIVKPRFGFRSRGLSVVNTRDELPFALANCENPVIQQLVGDAAHEYTCGTLCDQQGLISTIALRRDLKDGNTIRAYWDESCRTLNPFLERIAQTLGAFGPLNIQLRLLPQGPVVFEINPRFSGTTYMRTLFGVNEIQRLIDKREGKLLGGLDYREGVALRFYEDVFIELDAYNQWVKP